MNGKVLLASGVATIWNFFGGWLIYGVLLMEFYHSHTIEYEGLMKEMPDMLLLVISCFTSALLITLVVDKTGNGNLKGGAITGLWVGLLFQLSQDTGMASFFNLHDGLTVIAVNMVVTSAFYAVTGAIAGMILGRGNS